MQARGWEVHIAAPLDAAIFARLAGEGFVMHPIPLERSGINPLAELRLLLALWRLLRRLAPQLVHAVSMKPVIWGGIAARLARVPGLVLAITGLGSLFSRDTLKGSLVRFAILRLYGLALHHRHSCTIFQNPDDLALFRQQHLVRPGAWRMIKGCGVDMAAFAARPEPPGLPVVMFPGRLLGDKGVHEFVAAARLLKQQGVAARFVLVGRRDPENPSDIGAAALDAWQAEGSVEYWGFSTDMAATLAQANLIVFPSFYREGLPRGLIEAAATGRAIVTTDMPGCRDVVRHEENGLLVPPRDAAATAAAMRRLIEDAGFRQALGRRGREIAEAEFSVEHFVAESLKAYDAVLPAQEKPL